MQGFEDHYHNTIDYIVRITHRIWEDRDVEYIGDTYSPDSLVFDDYGLQPADALFVLRSLFGDSLAQATQIHNNRIKTVNALKL